MAGITPTRVYRVVGDSLQHTWAPSISYRFYDLLVNGEKVAELPAVPLHLKEMALGFLLSNGYVEDPGAVESISLEDSTIAVATTPDYEFRMRALRGKNPLEEIEIAPVTNSFSVSQEKILEKVSKAMNSSDLPFFAVSDTNGYFFSAEDVRSEVALFKAVGRAYVDGFDLRNSFFFTSFILFPEDVIRLAFLGVPVVGTTSKPTDLSISVAESLGITVFSVSIDGVFVYTHPSRIQ